MWNINDVLLLIPFIGVWILYLWRVIARFREWRVSRVKGGTPSGQELDDESDLGGPFQNGESTQCGQTLRGVEHKTPVSSVAEKFLLLALSLSAAGAFRDVFDGRIVLIGKDPHLFMWFTLLLGSASVVTVWIRQALDEHDKRLTKYFVSNIHKTANELDEQSKQQEKLTKELQTLVRTQPPEMFLKSSREVWRSAWEAYSMGVRITKGNKKTAQDVDAFSACIRSILKALCELADYYNDHQQGLYSATLMLYVPRRFSDKNEELARALQSQLKFAHLDTELTNQDGCLWVVQSWCVNDEGARNDKIHPIALPVPKTHKRSLLNGETEWYVLPGGPRCFVEQDPSLVPDTLELRSWMKDNSGFSDYLIEQLKSYMRVRSDTGRFRAFLSLPLQRTEVPEAKPIGVLNLESTEPGFFQYRMLKNDEDAQLTELRVNEFTSIVGPLVTLVAHLLESMGTTPDLVQMAYDDYTKFKGRGSSENEEE